MSGLSGTGFSPLSLSDVKTEIESALKSTLGPSVNLVAPSLLATLIGIFAERESLLWAEAENVYNSQYPDTAYGAALDNVVALTGLTRLSATYTKQVEQYLFGQVGTLVPAGTKFSVKNNPLASLVTDQAVTLIAGLNCVQNISFSSMPTFGSFKLAYNSEVTSPLSFAVSASDIQNALNGLSSISTVNVTGTIASGLTLTFVGASGLQPQPILAVRESSLIDALTDVVTVIPTFQSQGVAQGIASLTATLTGSTIAPAQSITVINTPVAGLNSTLNVHDAVTGRNIETDGELRIRRQKTLQVAGNATPGAIRSKLLNLDNVTDVFIFENVTFLPDQVGRPPKSYEVIVAGGDVLAISNTIFESKPAGIQTVGNGQYVVKDSQGFNQLVNWSRPTLIPIYLEIDIVKGFDYPVNGDALVKQSVIDFGNALKISQSVIVTPQLICAFDEVPGIIGVTVKIGIAPGPTLSQNIQINTAQIASFDSSRIVVVSA